MTLKTSPAGRAFIESEEGLFLQSYDDATEKIVRPGQKVKGTLTIGWGHTSDAGPPKVFIGQTITKDEADSILASDLAPVEEAVNRVVKVPLNQNQFDALVSLQFNSSALTQKHCTLLAYLNEGDYQSAADQFAMWIHSGGKVMKGLIKRRAAEKAMFLSPVKETA